VQHDGAGSRRHGSLLNARAAQDANHAARVAFVGTRYRHNPTDAALAATPCSPPRSSRSLTRSGRRSGCSQDVEFLGALAQTTGNPLYMTVGQLPIIDGHLELPDLRIEYETEDGRVEQRDVELVTSTIRAGGWRGRPKSAWRSTGLVSDGGGPQGGSTRTGGTPLDPHHLEALLCGVSFPIVASLLGWSPSTTTKMAKRYGHIGGAAHRQAVATLDPATGRTKVGTKTGTSDATTERATAVSA
jgi:hypothetical protein